MTNRSRSLVACALAMSGLLAVACDEPTTGTDGGPNPMMDGGGPGPGTDGGPGTDSGPTPDTDGGPTPSGCAAAAEDYCTLYESCDANRFLAAFENQEICRRVRAAACEDAEATPDIPLTNGLTDEDACEAAQVAGCDGILGGGPIPAACIPLPGEVATSEGACFTDAQCGIHPTTGRRMFCRPSSGQLGLPECPRGQCISAVAENGTCNPANIGTMQFCDTYAGQACLQAANDDMDGIDTADGTRCRTIQYGSLNAPCVDGTDLQCGAGFVCLANQCRALLDEGELCEPTRSACDIRRGLTCQDVDGENLCATQEYTEVGTQCGDVPVGSDTVNRECSAYASCDMVGATTVCVALKRLGEVCTVTPDNCEPGLECDPGTNRCVEIEIEPPTCP